MEASERSAGSQWRFEAGSNGQDLYSPCSMSPRTSFPPLANDWRSFRARLVSLEQGRVELATAMHMQHDVKWAHAIAHPERGCLLVARKMTLGMYTHSLVLMLEHDDRLGSTGLVINMPSPLVIAHLGMEAHIASAFGQSPVFIGGPLDQHNVHIMHARREVEGAMEVIDGCYIGGLDHATELVLSHEAMPSDFCLLVGYSQWSPGQLRREVEDGTWWILSASQGVVTECLRDVCTWDPYIHRPMASRDTLKRECWERVLRAAGIDPRDAR